MRLWGASEWKLGISLKPNKKDLEKIKGKGLGTHILSVSRDP